MRHPTNMLRPSITCLQRQTNRQAHEIDIADIRKKLCLIERKLCKVPLESDIRIARVRNTRFHERRTRIQCKRNGFADAEPEAGAGEVGNCHTGS